VTAYSLLLTKAALRDLQALPSDVRKVVDGVIRPLGDVPRPHTAVKLKNSDVHRVRVSRASLDEPSPPR
jgi:mRNA-degrading endonuclease RelE of RelBE toxin-antitoxin system